MIQVVLIAVSIGLVVLGIKGFTESGLALSSTTTLRGKQGKIVGTLCIIGGIGLIPLFFLYMWLLSK